MKKIMILAVMALGMTTLFSCQSEEEKKIENDVTKYLTKVEKSTKATFTDVSLVKAEKFSNPSAVNCLKEYENTQKKYIHWSELHDKYMEEANMHLENIDWKFTYSAKASELRMSECCISIMDQCALEMDSLKNVMNGYKSIVKKDCYAIKISATKKYKDEFGKERTNDNWEEYYIYKNGKIYELSSESKRIVKFLES